MTIRRATAGLTALIGVFLASAAASAADEILFNRDIRPILSENCFACHGPDQNKREADLRLDVPDDDVRERVLAPGDAEASELIARIDSDDPDAAMPPAETNKSLTAEEKELLKQWIEQGANYQGHWAYEPPVRAEIPRGENAIDHLVAAHLKERGISPSPEADRRTLARRLSFDLTGLPPTPAEVDAFLASDSPDAYETFVERLLASPHYGERMAIGWLDVVRFADTIGYHSDTPRNVWPYRDYVIRAFNKNKPFDRFTVEQLAGDLLENSTQEQKVASCFNRLLLTTEEGGAQAKDYEARMLTDRVRAVGTVWLGQTLGCCQCHDHKFDPLTTRDFYSMGAFFADITEPIIGRREAGMTAPTVEQAEELSGLREKSARLQQDYDATPEEIAAAQKAWERQVLDEAAIEAQWTVLRAEAAESEKNLKLTVAEDSSIFVEGDPADGTDAFRISMKTPLTGITGLRIEALPDERLPAKGPGRAGNGNFVVSEVRIAAGDSEAPVDRAIAAFEQEGFPALAAIDGESAAGNGWAVAGTAGKPSTLLIELAEPVGEGEETALAVTLFQNHGQNHVLGRFRISVTTQKKPLSLPEAALPDPELLAIVRKAPGDRNDGERVKLEAHFKSITPLLADLRANLEAAKKAAADYEASLPRCLVSVSSPNPRTVRFLPRGDWMDESGDVMQPALPDYLVQVMAPSPEQEETSQTKRLTRLDLANWIVESENPLTARVFVNRLWKQFFGVGLSRNTDDLGSQGEWPVYPELLDWLAVEFVESGWDVKHLVRTIVTSRTYRQASTASPELLAADPDNRLLARQSRFRIDAELVRDNALAVSGLLVKKIGGPSAKPYQPAGYWENLNFPRRTYAADSGENQHRRGMYTWWQRTFLHPSLMAFGAPTREECTADRVPANIPQQALVLLNDPTYVEAARVFGSRIVNAEVEGEGADADGERIVWAWRQALQRIPRDEELAVVRQVLEKHRVEFSGDSAAADALLGVGQTPIPNGVDKTELAAWTSVARIALNLHETITRP